MSNFRELIKNHFIKIPLIQRDYAQGRLDENTTHIRKSFLESIKENLSNDSNIHLDFIYGSIVKNTKQEASCFIPIDGQQRLTTIFLLFWFFGKKEKKGIEFLRNFSYETRTSSRDFIKFLLDCTSELNFEESIESQIKNHSQFIPYWEYDPTIKSIFVMLSAIREIFTDGDYFDKLDKITFKVFELEKFGLDDDLYIKMNARGKQLSEFEQFKSNFEGRLIKIDSSLAEEFRQKIESEWLEFFWNGYKDKNFLIDNAFINYFNFITKMLYKRTLSPPKTGDTEKYELYELIEEVYNNADKNVDNIKFLFRSLDLLKKVEEKIKLLFHSNHYVKGKVVLFDKNPNILEKIITPKKGNDINLQQEVLLFIVINYLVNQKDDDINKDEDADILKDIVRVVRNFIHRIRTLKAHRCYYDASLTNQNANVIIANFSKINKNIYKYLCDEELDTSHTGISKKSLEQEIKKANLINDKPHVKEFIFKLEDCRYLKGDLKNFLELDEKQIERASVLIPQIYNLDDSLVARAMLSIGEYQMSRGWTMHNQKKYFGREGYWEIILTQDNDSFQFKDLFKDLIDKLSQDANLEEQLNNIIKNYLASSPEKNWKYYFIKYESFLQSNKELSKDFNIFEWRRDFKMEKMGGATTKAYHVNPFIYEVSKKTTASLQTMTSRDHSKLIIHNQETACEIFINGYKWIISIQDSFDRGLLEKIKDKFSGDSKPSENIYFLESNEDEDFIEVMINFIRDINPFSSITP